MKLFFPKQTVGPASQMLQQGGMFLSIKKMLPTPEQAFQVPSSGWMLSENSEYGGTDRERK